MEPRIKPALTKKIALKTFFNSMILLKKENHSKPENKKKLHKPKAH